ncbi:hypothetical protein RB195_012171 [Necator americanus]
MRFFHTFYVMLLKNALIAYRSPIWTIFELVVPIILGMILLPIITFGSSVSSMATVLQNMNGSASSERNFSPISCSLILMFYVNSGPDKDDIEILLNNTPMERTRFNSSAVMIDYLEMTKSFGIEFILFKEKRLVYKVYNIDDSENVFAVSATTEVFSTQTSTYNLIPIPPSPKDEAIAVLQVCLTLAVEKKSFDEKIGFDYEIVNVVSNEDSTVRGPLTFLSGALPMLLMPIVMHTAMTTASEKEGGMKEFLLVMGLDRVTNFLGITVFSLLKVLLVIAIIVRNLIFEIPRAMLPILVPSLFLFSLGIVMMGMLCAAFVKTSNGALTVSMLVLILMFFVQSIMSNIYDTSFIHYLCHLDFLVAYGNVLNSLRLHYMRGKNKIYLSKLFLYDDIIDVGPSLTLFLITIILMMLLVLFLDYISLKSLLPCFYDKFGKKLVDIKASEVAQRSSWHEEAEGVGEPALDVDSVSKIWETTGEVAVRNFNMKAYRGQVTVLLGHNGAGKSTTYAMICGTTPATAGTITVLGEQISTSICGMRPAVGFCPQTNCIYKKLTVEDHLWLFFILKGGKGVWKDEADLLCIQLDMVHLSKKKAGKLSGGEKRKLCLAMAFIGGSELVMLDEPTAGLDPQSRVIVKKLIETKKKDRAIVLTTHYLDEAEAMGNFMYIMYMGTCMCSGTPNFLKARFAPGIILNLVFSQNVSKEVVDAAVQVVKEHIEEAEVGEMNGKQLRIEMPRNQRENIPKLFAELENKKESLKVDSFGLSMNALEEAFLKIGEIGEKASSHEKPRAFFQDPTIMDLRKGFCERILQQIFYIWFQKVHNARRNISLITNQIIFPLALAILIGWKAGNSTRSEITSVEDPDMSLNRIKRGRFLIFDAFNSTDKVELIEKALEKYPNIEIMQYSSNNWEELWPTDFPWAAGGVIIRSETEVSVGSQNYSWLIPSYIYHKEQTLFHFITDVEYAAGNLQVHVMVTYISKDVGTLSMLFLIPALIFLIAVMLNSTFVTPLLEERLSNFRHQQMLAGLSPLVFWATTFVWDSFIIGFVTLTMKLIFVIYKVNINWMLMFLFYAYCVTILPLIYVISLFIDGKGKAEFLCQVYQIGTVVVVFILIYRGHEIQTVYFFPCYAFGRILLTELLPDLTLSGENVSNGDAVVSFLVHGGIFSFLLIIHEFHFDRYLLRALLKKTYIEKSDVPDEADVIEEREFVENNISELALAVQNLTKYYGTNCALKSTTYGIREEDCFGLVGASGAGKTSTFDIITGLRFANNGSVFIGNKFVNRTQGIGYCPQSDALLPRLTCEQNMKVIAGLLGYRHPRMVADEMFRFLDLTKHAGKAFGKCSGGQKRRVSIGAALLNPSRLVILDEPTAGIDPKTRHHVWSLLKTMRISGRALLLSSHSMEKCEALCSRIGVLVRGRLVAIGASQTLKSRHAHYFFLHMTLNSQEDKDTVISKVLKTFPSGDLVPAQSGSLYLKFKIRQRKEERISMLYETAEEMASSLPLSEFFLIQASLEDVLEILNEQYGGKIL